MRGERSLALRAAVVPVLAILCSIALITSVRSALAQTVKAVKPTSDTFALPPPHVVSAMSLGYGSALADLLFASTAISYAQHGEERRRFDDVGKYLDTIVELDPRFRDPYRLADTFIIFQAKGNPTEDQVRHARRLLDRGRQMRPFDGYLWLAAGQFMTFIAPQFLTNEEERREYRVSGARVMVRAGELVNDKNVNIQAQAMAGGIVLEREGLKGARFDQLDRLYLVTDDEEIKAEIARRLDALKNGRDVDRARRHADRFDDVWRREMPFVSRNRFLVLGPAPELNPE